MMHKAKFWKQNRVLTLTNEVTQGKFLYSKMGEEEDNMYVYFRIT